MKNNYHFENRIRRGGEVQSKQKIDRGAQDKPLPRTG
jgi:hypothetical protein